jgi:glycosyltransferase involved in cell wall biosynthesis
MPRDDTPKVSVCIPSYNAARYLREAIESVLAQEFSDFEAVVSDDASTDCSAEVCDRYADPRFRVVTSSERLGQSGNWNRCLELARGEYVILLHADDVLSPGYLRRAVELLDAEDDIGLVHCSAQHVDERGKALQLQRLWDQDRVDSDGVTLQRLLLDGCVINPAGVLVRRAVYEQGGAFTDDVVWGVDWHMWIRIALRWDVGYLAEPLALYREHGHSGTAAVMTSGRNARDELWVIDDVFRLVQETQPELYGLKPRAIRGVAHRTWCFAEHMCEVGEVAAARVGLRNAVATWPGMIRQPRVWALWAATYLGYAWFRKAHMVKRRVTERWRRRAPRVF